MSGMKIYYSWMALAIIGWGFSSSFIEFGLKYVSPFNFLTIRFVLASILLTPYILVTRKDAVISLLKNRWLYFIGLSESAGLAFQYLGQQQGVPAGLSALLSLIFLIFVPFLSPFLLGERVNKYHIRAIIIGIVGVLIIASDGNFSNLIEFDNASIIGIILLVLAALSYAMYIVTTSRLLTKEKTDTDTTALFYLVLVIVSIVSTILTVIYEGVIIPTSNQAWIWIGLLVLLSTLIAFFAYFNALKGISANSASVLLLLQSLIPFIIDVFILDRIYSSIVIIGVILLLIAMIQIVIIPYLLKENNLE